MSIGPTGGWPTTSPTSPRTFTASQLVPLYALMSGSSGAASPELVASLVSAAQAADAEAATPAPAAAGDLSQPSGGPAERTARPGESAADAAGGVSAPGGAGAGAAPSPGLSVYA